MALHPQPQREQPTAMSYLVVVSVCIVVAFVCQLMLNAAQWILK